MINKSIMMLMVIFLFSQLPCEKTEAADFYSYIPLIYKVPEGCVGVFKNGNQFYDDVYPAGLYITWPFDEGFNISIIPGKETVTEIPCITVEGIKITFPKITVHYQIHENDALELVKHHGVDFLKPLIKNPVKQGVSDLCSTMTAEAVYLEKFAILKQYMIEYLTREVVDQEPGLSIADLEIDRPRIPDEILENFVGRNVSPDTCDQPYEIFYTLEDEKAARERLCGPYRQGIELQQNPVQVDDMASVEENLVTVVEPAALPASNMDTDQETPLQPEHEIPCDCLLHQQVIDPFIDENSKNPEAGPVETSLHLIQDGQDKVTVNTEAINSPGFEAGTNRTQPVGLDDQQLSRDRKKIHQYQQAEDFNGLWKSNSSRLYLTW